MCCWIGLIFHSVDECLILSAEGIYKHRRGNLMVNENKIINMKRLIKCLGEYGTHTVGNKKSPLVKRL